MSRVLLVVHVNTYFTVLLPVAKLLRQSGRYEPVFVFVRDYPRVRDDAAVCTREGIEFLLQPSEAPSSDSAQSRGNGPIWRGLKQVANRLPDGMQESLRRLTQSAFALASDNVVRHVRALSKRIDAVRRLVRDQSAALLVFAADNRYDIAAYVKAAHLEGKPVVLTPAWMAGPLEWAEHVATDPAHDLRRWGNAIAGRLFSRWVYRHKGQALLALPASQVLAREWLGLAPPLPWVTHSGEADAIAVESEAVRASGLSDGLSDEKLIVTGSPALDRMAGILARRDHCCDELYGRLGLPAGRPMILSPLPPDYHRRGRGEAICGFATYADLVRFWITSLCAHQDRYNIVISLHPSVQFDTMQYVEAWGARIARDSIADLIPLSEVFVTGPSATTQWAIACGKPILEYDVYRYNYRDFQDVAGLIAVKERTEFLSILERLTCDTGFRAETAARQAAHSGRWGKLDGAAGDRMLEVFDRLVAGPTQRSMVTAS